MKMLLLKLADFGTRLGLENMKGLRGKEFGQSNSQLEKFAFRFELWCEETLREIALFHEWIMVR